MKRRKFLEKLGLGAAAVVVAPKIIEAKAVYKTKTEIKARKGYPLTPEAFMHPRSVTTTSELTKEPERTDMYVVKLNKEVRAGTTIYVPSSFSNAPISVPASVLSAKSDKTVRLAVLNTLHKIKPMPVGTVLLLGGSAFSDVSIHNPI